MRCHGEEKASESRRKGTTVFERQGGRSKDL